MSHVRCPTTHVLRKCPTTSLSDGSDDFEIDPNEFASAMRKKLGYRGPNVLLNKTFALLDTDGSGKM